MNIQLRQQHNYNDTKLNVETALNHDTRKYRKYLSSIIYDYKPGFKTENRLIKYIFNKLTFGIFRK